GRPWLVGIVFGSRFFIKHETSLSVLFEGTDHTETTRNIALPLSVEDICFNSIHYTSRASGSALSDSGEIALM
ncbi:hypothetical protein L9F63_006116, partial [Diploptera punctata]